MRLGEWGCTTVEPRRRLKDEANSRSPGETRSQRPLRLHAVVIGAAAAFRWDPGDDLVRVHDVAGFTVHTVGRIQRNALAVRGRAVVHHLVDIGGTKILAGAAEFHDAALAA